MNIKIQEIVQMGEGLNVEFKSNFNAACIETLVAFANSKGGSIFIGINNQAEVKGLTISSESIQQWVNEVKSKTSPELIPDAYVHQHNDKYIVELVQQEYPLKPVGVQGRFFKRIENSNHLLSVGEVANLHLQSINSSWDAYIDPLHTMDSLSMEKIEQVISMLKQKGRTVDDDPMAFLSKYSLLRDGKPTFAAYLLFKKEDCFISTIELGRFQSPIIIKDSDRTKADLITQVDVVMNFIKKHINKAVIITEKPQNTEKWDYPLEAIREIVMNMIVHRDYRASADSIVKVFDKKIEFYNPGVLPDGITINDLLTNNYKSNPRNKLVADLFKDLGLIEKYGSGIGRVIYLLKEAGLPLPEFSIQSGGITVTVFALNEDKVTDNVTDNVTDTPIIKALKSDDIKYRKKKIISLLQSNSTLSLTKLSEKLHVSKMTISRDIEELKKSQQLKRVGKNKGGYWEVL